jgi:hypothetical protein
MHPALCELNVGHSKAPCLVVKGYYCLLLTFASHHAAEPPCAAPLGRAWNMPSTADPCTRPLRSLRLGFAGEVESISIGGGGGVLWSCAGNCYGTTCALDSSSLWNVMLWTLPDAIGNLSCRSKITEM